jgi:hypothetical protein
VHTINHTQENLRKESMIMRARGILQVGHGLNLLIQIIMSGLDNLEVHQEMLQYPNLRMKH